MSGLGQQIKHPLRSQQGLEGAEEDQDQETEVQKGLNTFKALRNTPAGAGMHWICVPGQWNKCLERFISEPSMDRTGGSTPCTSPQA